MFRWLFRKKKDVHEMSNNAKDNKNGGGLPKEVLAKLRIPRKFEIFVEEYTEGDIGCQAGWRPVSVDSKLGGNGGNPVITVNSQADLQEKQNLYKTLGQRFTIVREIDPPSFDDIKKAAIEQGLIKSEDVEKICEHKKTEQEQPHSNPDIITTKPEQTEVKPMPVPAPATAPAPVCKREIKYYKIGGVEIKDDNGCLYQRQWLRLSPQEESNFRIVSDNSNKVISLKGKHLEEKKWIKIENDSEGIEPNA